MAALHRDASEACGARGYHLALEDIDPTRPGSIDDLAKSLQHVKFDGVLMSPPVTDFHLLLNLLDRRAIPYVRIDPRDDHDRSPATFGANASGVEKLVDHLWSLRHRMFG